MRRIVMVIGTIVTMACTVSAQMVIEGNIGIAIDPNDDRSPVEIAKELRPTYGVSIFYELSPIIRIGLGVSYMKFSSTSNTSYPGVGYSVAVIPAMARVQVAFTETEFAPFVGVDVGVTNMSYDLTSPLGSNLADGAIVSIYPVVGFRYKLGTSFIMGLEATLPINLSGEVKTGANDPVNTQGVQMWLIRATAAFPLGF